MKKVLYIVSGRSLCLNNIGRKILSIIACWRNLGYEVKTIFGGDVASHRFFHTKKTFVRSSKIPWYRRSRLLAPFVNSYSEILDIRQNQKMVQYINSVVKSFHPDIIWARSYRLQSAGLSVAKLKSTPYVHEWTDHLIPYSISLYHHKAVEIEKHKNQQADYIVVVSKKLREDLAQEGMNRDKILVTYNAVDPQVFQSNLADRQEYRAELGIGADEVLIGYLGSYAFYHDMIRLVLAADILRGCKKPPIKILMVGTGEQYGETLQLAEKQNLLNSTVIMKPWVPKETVPKILPSLDIAVLPGCTDIICPIKVQEYMASELAVVVPDYLCNREVVTEGQTGVFFEPKNEKSLADKLLLLARDSRMRATLGKNAREEALRRFTWEQTWGKALQEIMRRIGYIDNDGL